MDRVCSTLTNKIMSADQAAQMIQSGMTVAMSGFTTSGYPKAIPGALVRSGHARELTVLIGASSGDELDGAMSRAGLIARRYSFQSNPDMRKAINRGDVLFSDMHVSQFPRFVRQGVGPRIDVAVVECTAVTEDGLIPTAAVGCVDAVVMKAEKIIVEVNETLPMEIVGMHDIYTPNPAPDPAAVPIFRVDDRIGRPYVPCDPDKIAAIVIASEKGGAPAFKPVDEISAVIGSHVADFLKEEVRQGRLPKNLGPLQSGVGSVGNAILASLTASGFRDLEMYTETMQDAVLELIETGVIRRVSTTSVSLSPVKRDYFYEHIDRFRDRIVLRTQEISNYPEVIRRLGVIALNTPIEVDLYGNVNSTHIMGSGLMNGIGGGGDFVRNGALNLFTTQSTAKGGAISCIVPMVTHVDHTEHDTHVIITEYGVADLRWTAPSERVALLIDRCAHPDYRPMLREYARQAQLCATAKHTPHDLAHAFDMHVRYLRTGTMKLLEQTDAE